MNQNARPRFYEGQYLGAPDLAAGVDYARLRSARHELGAHVWGIAAGLELVEQPLASGVVQVTVSPGYAWDGYGRPIVLLAPQRLSADLFRNFTADTAPEGDIVKIWLRYDESEAQNPAPGFEVCRGDQHSRIVETFAVEVGELDTTHKVVVNARTVDAKLVRQALNTAGPQLRDESVPYQEIPDTGALPPWRILLGYVRWFRQGSAPGYLKARDDSGTPRDSDRIRELRRYIGVVAEEVLAADGALRIRDRNKAPSIHYVPPAATTDPKNPPNNDLLWVEGHTRIEGDARLVGGQVEWRNNAGDFASVPMLARRINTNAKGGKSLELAFANTTPAPQGKNSLVFGPITQNPDGSFGNVEAKVIVQDNGDVGVGTATPRSRLEVMGRSDQPGTAYFVPDAGKGQNISYVHWDTTGDWYIRSAAAAGKIILQDTGGNVGVGTTSPDRAVTVQGSAGTYVNIKANGGTQEVFIGADSAGGIVSTMTNHDLQLRAGQNSTKMLIQKDGNVGVGSLTPRSRLEVIGRSDQAGTANFVPDAGKGDNISHVHWDPTGDWYIRSAASTGKVVLQDSGGNVGIGTSNPGQKLHVAGQFLRVDGVDGEQAELGSEGNGSVVVGSRKASITLVDFRNLTVPFSQSTVNAWLGLWCKSVHEVSDANSKAKVEPLVGALSSVMRLQGVSYLWKDEMAEQQTPARRLGLIAQEVQKVVPEAVSISERGAGISYSTMVPVLIEALKELKSEVDSLQELKAKYTKLEDELARLKDAGVKKTPASR